ncbi:trifunctional transcriptional regulator/proline dehydrogenase/L-glutamate gamma-semialdehyde dehydrogenase [Lampropedia puyangensis]|uniref:Bifunctional protein PutA n=1 Tax=Lampropedia puyangensis TaxID=1330072 RepID=A0A4S8F282_9BURK|nr:trifunctional transcriptional regulator/proline dehydrogenase/L-glutamate gamma-semialdehyde dehydrogenase [Lampropedia puyangensis]THU01087.1 trifunctional transcriptional regulator/proline dehydrogenase/L-glutamate gamma-semialdehyde dehydrogenase [Lampropedia puyangensis]
MCSTSVVTAAAPFACFIQPAGLGVPALRAAITAAWRQAEPEAVAHVVQGARLPAGVATASSQLAERLAYGLRNRKASGGRAGLVQSLLQEYALSSQEGVALMCLAEALLRIPDAATRDALIRDKVAHGQWAEHLGHSRSMFVNAATWGLLLTGKLVGTHSEAGLSSALARLINAGGEPLIRKSMDMAMRMMGEQFVTGETIEEALSNGQRLEAKGFRYSYDMLGEAALTARDAERYLRDYEQAIHAIGKASNGRGVYEGPGISIKLSALHPRYSRAQYDRVMGELYPTLVRLCALAKRYDIGINIDAEEADRLEISLDLLELLAHEPQLQGWQGLGFVIQAYQKRCPYVIDYLVDLAKRSQRRLMVRLVKGAYWDSEIKRAQVDGQSGYPVYTRKPYTDASYLHCARKLLAEPDAIYPQFATHNAHSLAAIYTLANPANYYPGQYEFQCLHGMGESLYEQVVGAEVEGQLGRPCRIYAPVGTHETLLAYLVRRLLENGANTSFVNRIADQHIPIADLVQDPVVTIDGFAQTEGALGLPHPAIPLPRHLYGALRVNSRGLDLADEHSLQQLQQDLVAGAQMPVIAEPLLAEATAIGRSSVPAGSVDMQPVLNPANHRDVVGFVRDATVEDVRYALDGAQAAAQSWAATPAQARAQMLLRAADQLEEDMPRLMGILMREAGKTASNAIAEVREAVDFLRYYGHQVGQTFENAIHKPLGPVVCISPWNFPLAIFLGQVSASLAAGNVVLAKPAEQTPLIAAEAVRALWRAGVPKAVVQLLPGAGGTVGAQLVADARVQGVLFTGSTEVAHLLQRNVADRVGLNGRSIALIAETGGQNAMIVDSSALVEQVVGDVLSSAFDSAGQRCSALRVLCVQEDVADRVLEMLLGAMAELRVGNPAVLANDVGPVIDVQAKQVIEQHIESMRAIGKRVHRANRVLQDEEGCLRDGTFVLPTVIEINHISELKREVFGPVVHFLRYRREDLGELITQINETGYGLTLGVHTRIDETVAQVVQTAEAGNVYVNRNMVGAVVGVQPFGGEGLSGTGPKAGGPLYLHRLLAQAPYRVLGMIMASREGANDSTINGAANTALQAMHKEVWEAYRAWGTALDVQQVHAWEALSERLPTRWQEELTGPTGEGNCYRLVPRERVLCLAEHESDLLIQLAAIVLVGSQAAWPAQWRALWERLPALVRGRVKLVQSWHANEVSFDLALLHGTREALLSVQQQLAQREGAIVAVECLEPGCTTIALERLVIERAVSTNTAAAGGNASLMAMA